MIKPTQKQCKNCKKNKCVQDFYKDSGSKDGHLKICAQCTRNINRSRKMVCHECGSTKSIIIDSRSCETNFLRRRRKCLNCNNTYTTVEIHKDEYESLQRIKEGMEFTIKAVSNVKTYSKAD